MAFLNFLREGRRDITVVHVNHGTDHGNRAEEFVREKCEEYDLDLWVGDGSPYTKHITSNFEAEWRDIRYTFFNMFMMKYDLPLITAHHLDDCVETWLFSTLHGNPKTIPYERQKIIRPFLMVSKEQIEKYVFVHDIDYIQDPSNYDIKHTRNFIRHKLIPQALRVNPGLKKMVANIVQDRYNRLHG